MGAGAGLRVVLHRKGRHFLAPQPLKRVVVEVPVGHLCHRLVQTPRVHGKPVVLAGNLNLARRQVLHRVVEAPVAELQLVGPGAQGQGQDLMPQADAENGHPPQQPLHRLDGRFHGSGITGTIGQEHAVGP